MPYILIINVMKKRKKTILVFGLPGSGKTTFCKNLIKNKDIKHFNADEVRKEANDWDFSEEGRTRQVERMLELVKLEKNKVSIVDMVCPYDIYRKKFNTIVWMNTILNSKYKDTNNIFEKPKKVDYEIKDFNYNFVITQINETIC
tara:strand:+ start:178 stop:612 length:435 start_codon:yes stop_codon:yes gene_type:complete